MATSEDILPFISKGTILDSSDPTAVYTCPTRTWAQVTLIWITDDGGASGAVSVSWFDSSANTVFILGTSLTFEANDALVFELDRLALDEADQIRVTGATGYHVVVSAIENARRT